MTRFEVDLEALFEDPLDQGRIMAAFDAAAVVVGKKEGKELKLVRTYYHRRIDVAGNPIHVIATYKEVTDDTSSHD